MHEKKYSINKKFTELVRCPCLLIMSKQLTVLKGSGTLSTQKCPKKRHILGLWNNCPHPYCCIGSKPTNAIESLQPFEWFQRHCQEIPKRSPTSMEFSTATISSQIKVKCSVFAENDTMIAVENYIEPGNLLGLSWQCLSRGKLCCRLVLTTLV